MNTLKTQQRLSNFCLLLSVGYQTTIGHLSLLLQQIKDNYQSEMDERTFPTDLYEAVNSGEIEFSDLDSESKVIYELMDLSNNGV